LEFFVAFNGSIFHEEIIKLSGNPFFKMREHLIGALKRKSPLAWSWASDTDNKQ